MSRLFLLLVVLVTVGAAPLGSEPGGPRSPESGANAWALPEPGSCAPAGGLRGFPYGVDAPPVPFKVGDVFEIGQLEILKNVLPPDFWAYRERFFYEGMRLEIGACFRDYGAAEFYQKATDLFRGQATLLDNGGLTHYTAGQPFPSEDVPTDDPLAGLRFAWNVEHRYQGAGFRTRFRRVDLLGRIGHAEAFEGDLFKLILSHRADRPDDDYVAPGAKSKHWVAGGLFTKPFASREFAWRQYRDLEHQVEPGRSDDLHAYLPQWRRVRRLNASNIEGLYMPSPSVGVVPNQQLVIGSGGVGGLGGGGVGMAAAGGGGAGLGSMVPKNSGFEGLEIRPLLYDYRILGVQDVLTPMNVARPLYPEDPDREFGPWGLSFASDRWDLRRAVVLEAKIKKAHGGDHASRLILYQDLQTFQPLYYMSWDSRNEPVDIGYFVGRWSEDQEEYPGWADDPERPVRVIDSVGAAFANLSESGSWRRESWDVVSTPPKDRVVKRMISVSNLTRRH